MSQIGVTNAEEQKLALLRLQELSSILFYDMEAAFIQLEEYLALNPETELPVLLDTGVQVAFRRSFRAVTSHYSEFFRFRRGIDSAK